MNRSRTTRLSSPELGDLNRASSPLASSSPSTMPRTKQTSRRSTGGTASRSLRSTPRVPSSTSSLMSKPGLLTIPVELQTSIVSYLTSFKDLKNACLVCKELQVIATPLLYRTVTLTLCQLNDRLKRSFNATNKGMTYVRTLTIVEPHGSYRHSRHGPPLTHLLQSLPKDGLTAFRFDGYALLQASLALTMTNLCTSGIVSNDMVMAVRLRQRHLTHFVLNHVKAPPLADFLPDTDELRNFTSFAFYLGTKHDASRGASILQAASSIRNLALAVPGGTFCNRETCRDLFETLLSTWLLIKDDTKLRVRCIKLEDFDLHLVAPILATVIDAGALNETTLLRCRNSNRLLEVLTQLRPNLKTLTDDRAYHSTREKGMLGELLHSFSGLEKLRLSTEIYSAVKDDCDWPAIERHSASLRTLHIDDFGKEYCPFAIDGVRSMAGFHDLLKQCRSLKELAVRAPSPDCFGITALTTGPFVNALKELSNLRTPRLFVYLDALEPPDMESEDEFGSPMCGHADELRTMQAKSQVHNMANKVFDELHGSCQRFVALVIEPRPPNVDYGLDDGGEKYGFVRVLKKDLYGRVVAAAEECEWNTIRFHEPCCDILSDDLGIMSAP